MAAQACSHLGCATRRHDPRTAPTSATAFLSTPSAFPIIVASSLLASNMGPLVAEAVSLGCCSFTHSLRSATPAVMLAAKLSHSFSTPSGPAKASSSASLGALRGPAVSLSFCDSSSKAFNFSRATPITASASVLSLRSTWAILSASSFLAKSLFAACTFAFKPWILPFSKETASRIFENSALAAFRGPSPTLVSSALLARMDFSSSAAALSASLIFPSSSWENFAIGDSACR
mmetsp:Transcript_120452/g.300495  ORF Transcript_120452/g.300495 Transcript_120452/m.300495 type:complete len:233 (+) Transcript_120452:1413-2111(+)